MQWNAPPESGLFVPTIVIFFPFFFCPIDRVLGRWHQAWHCWQSAHIWKLHAGEHHGAESEHSVLPLCGCFQHGWPRATVGAHQLHHKETTWVRPTGAFKSVLKGSAFMSHVSLRWRRTVLSVIGVAFLQLCCLCSQNPIWQASFPFTLGKKEEKINQWVEWNGAAVTI